MAKSEDQKKDKKTKLINPQDNKVTLIQPGKFRPFSKDQQLNKSPKAPRGGRR